MRRHRPSAVSWIVARSSVMLKRDGWGVLFGLTLYSWFRKIVNASEKQILPGFPDGTAYEPDHPLTRKIKKTALLNCLKEGYFPEAGNEKRFHLISTDLGSESPSVVLEAAGFQKEIPAVILEEGLFMYTL